MKRYGTVLSQGQTVAVLYPNSVVVIDQSQSKIKVHRPLGGGKTHCIFRDSHKASFQIFSLNLSLPVHLSTGGTRYVVMNQQTYGTRTEINIFLFLNS